MNYQQADKPVCDWEDAAAREQLVDALLRDRYRALDALRGRQLGPQVAQAAELLATVIGQDIQEPADGCYLIAQGVAPDRVISVVDPQARHGHKSNARGLTAPRACGHRPRRRRDYAAEVGAANTGNAAMTAALLRYLQVAAPVVAEDLAADTWSR
jgi:hypothetical protein